jgi:hypothetical protein
MMQALLRWAPPIVGSVPAILLAGYALERFALDHSEEVVKLLGHFVNDGKEGAGIQPPGEARQLVGGLSTRPVGNRLDAYLGGIQRKQMERGSYGRPPLQPFRAPSASVAFPYPRGFESADRAG